MLQIVHEALGTKAGHAAGPQKPLAAAEGALRVLGDDGAVAADEVVRALSPLGGRG